MIKEIKRLIKKYGNDYELGQRVRQLLKNGKQCKTDNRRNECNCNCIQ